MKSAEACLRSALFRFCGIGRSPNSEESHRLYELSTASWQAQRFLYLAVYAFESSKNGESIFIISVGGKPSALRSGALRAGRRSSFSISYCLLR